jgi:sulfhydrogenase subunit beta (sulfur reductase)
MNYQIGKSDLPTLITHWMETAQVYAPARVENFTAFKKLADASEIVWEGPQNTRIPPRSLFLPQSEVLLQYQDGCLVPTLPPKDTRIIFGIRPCDAHAVTLLDTVFNQADCVDPYWKIRRDHTILVGMGCRQPVSTCFCNSTGYGPFDPATLDVLITELDDVFTLEVLSETGASILNGQAILSAENQSIMADIQKKAADGMPRVLETGSLREHLYAIFDSDYWKKISQSCLGCGVCTFLCPTCFCFDIVDETHRSERVRNWDTCMFRVYSQEASGHNPRPGRAERTRQRLMHKFSYWLDHAGQTGCVGCGRCVQQCPVGFDIREMIRQARVWEAA